ncbi:MAG: tRNA (adenosine(37)-N6)-dimethylallyltransferase MiaA, partial [Planctomycetota bacterium]
YRIPHHLVDIVDANQEFSVAEYLQAATAAVHEIRARDRVPVFVGGTPMYLRGVLRGFDVGPPADWEFRESCQQDLQDHGIQALRQRLRLVDPLSAMRIESNDTRRMIRALEVYAKTGVPISHRQVHFDQRYPAESVGVFALSWDRSILHERINRRTSEMFDRGLVDEVRRIRETTGFSRTASAAVGYREVLQHIDGELSLAETMKAVAAHTRQLARKQETWFRNLHELRSVPMTPDSAPQAIADWIVAKLPSSLRGDSR